MKIKKVNGAEYSREEFTNYNLRVKVEFKTKTDVHIFDIYTTERDKEKVWDDLLESITNKVTSFNIIHSSTREQDELSSKWIGKWLNEI